eukprot:CAMPEP_0201967436 /NCGR_PEP_ID=MMETSP0904-20121228/12108_1 /ASSEMBLY_ACC=CAM_ASM_000553 /TAXON_ID=420261 /ORGANISM="Thalassiosira antarctica, Strain CCMP982" /LENGTH=223 /DNA_ID=CAMNT_0048514873 /DNA_START=483 /DNA_END=1150 /DNA_ORIENTATION=-
MEEVALDLSPSIIMADASDIPQEKGVVVEGRGECNAEAVADADDENASPPINDGSVADVIATENNNIADIVEEGTENNEIQATVTERIATINDRVVALSSAAAPINANDEAATASRKIDNVALASSVNNNDGGAVAKNDTTRATTPSNTTEEESQEEEESSQQPTVNEIPKQQQPAAPAVTQAPTFKFQYDPPDLERDYYNTLFHHANPTNPNINDSNTILPP